jgi:hypothetical protein
VQKSPISFPKKSLSHHKVKAEERSSVSVSHLRSSRIYHKPILAMESDHPLRQKLLLLISLNPRLKLLVLGEIIVLALLNDLDIDNLDALVATGASSADGVDSVDESHADGTKCHTGGNTDQDWEDDGAEDAGEAVCDTSELRVVAVVVVVVVVLASLLVSLLGWELADELGDASVGLGWAVVLLGGLVAEEATAGLGEGRWELLKGHVAECLELGLDEGADAAEHVAAFLGLFCEGGFGNLDGVDKDLTEN